MPARDGQMQRGHDVQELPALYRRHISAACLIFKSLAEKLVPHIHEGRPRSDRGSKDFMVKVLIDSLSGTNFTITFFKLLYNKSGLLKIFNY